MKRVPYPYKLAHTHSRGDVAADPASHGPHNDGPAQPRPIARRGGLGEGVLPTSSVVERPV
eukprot:scaffold2739_cov153-Isochrysis_galbana.AAC.1